MSVRDRCRRQAFTLIELLVVIAIIALLIGILMPALSGARERSRSLLCKSRLHELSRGAMMYALDNVVYPPCIDNIGLAVPGISTDKAGLDWLGVGDQFGAFAPGIPGDPNTGNPKGFVDAPKWGLLYRYTLQDPKIVLCPSENSGPYLANQMIGNGNGVFSYTMVAGMGLRSPERIPTAPHFSGNSRPSSSASLFVQEHPDGCNNQHREGNFWGGGQPGPGGGDKLVSRHFPFNPRPGVMPGTGGVTRFNQGETNVGFADGHADAIRTSFGFGRTEMTAPGGGGIIGNNVVGLLYYYGVDYNLLPYKQ